MELEDFIEKVAEQFVETEPEEITADTPFKELEEWSSLIALCLIAMVDENYGIQVKAEDFKEAKTFRDLFNIISQKTGKE